jgi:hypothetical protein
MLFATVPDEFLLAIPLKLTATASTDRSSGCRTLRCWTIALETTSCRARDRGDRV